MTYIPATSNQSREERVEGKGEPLYKSHFARFKYCIEAKTYDDALVPVKRVVELLTTGKIKGRGQGIVNETFRDLAARGSTLPPNLYGWIVLAATWNLQKKGTSHHKVVSGYEKAVGLGCLEAAEYLALTLESQGIESVEKREEVLELYKKASTTSSNFILGFIFQKGWKSTDENGAMKFDESLVDLGLAVMYYRKSLAIDPDYIYSCEALAETILLIDREGGKEEAIGLYQKVVLHYSREKIVDDRDRSVYLDSLVGLARLGIDRENYLETAKSICNDPKESYAINQELIELRKAKALSQELKRFDEAYTKAEHGYGAVSEELEAKDRIIESLKRDLLAKDTTIAHLQHKLVAVIDLFNKTFPGIRT